MERIESSFERKRRIAWDSNPGRTDAMADEEKKEEKPKETSETSEEEKEDAGETQGD